MKLRQKENKKTSRRIDETFLCELHPTHKCRTGRTMGRERRLRRAFNKSIASSYCKAIYCAFSGKRSSNQCVKTYSTNISLIIRAMRSAVPGRSHKGAIRSCNNALVHRKCNHRRSDTRPTLHTPCRRPLANGRPPKYLHRQ